jgi:hypothetical protein
MAHSYRFRKDQEADGWVQVGGDANLCIPGVEANILCGVTHDPQTLDIVFVKQKPRNFDGPVFQVHYNDDGDIETIGDFPFDDLLIDAQNVITQEARDEGYNFIKVVIPPAPPVWNPADDEIVAFRRRSDLDSDYHNPSRNITLCHSGTHRVFRMPTNVGEFNMRLHKVKPPHDEAIELIKHPGGNVTASGLDLTLYENVAPAMRQAYRQGFRYFSLEYKES